jgi:hypothetical protein
MKALTIFAFLFSASSFAAPASFEQVLLIEKAAQKELGDLFIEVLSADVTWRGRSLISDVTFSYDKEFFNPYSVVTFNCVGIGAGRNFSFLELACVEDEPVLWDEF